MSCGNNCSGCQCGSDLTEQEALERDAVHWRETEDFLVDYLKMWKSDGIPAPLNELQSIAAWLRASCNVEEMQNAMRLRMILLMKAVEAINEKGLDAEILAGIYANRPDLEAEARKVYEQSKEK